MRAIVGGVILSIASAAWAAQPFNLASHPSIDPSKFRITTFASGLQFTTGVQRLSDGSMLVAISEPNAGGSFYASTGKLLRLTDNNLDGVADDAGTYLNTGLPGSIVQMRMAGDILIVNSADPVVSKISFLRKGPTPSSPFTNLGSLNLDFPDAGAHQHDTYALAVVPNLVPNQYQVLFNVGSRLNGANNTTQVPASGLLTASLNPESIYRMTMTDTGSGVSLSGLQQLASGLRNAAGIAFHPQTGDLWFQDNGIDGASNEPTSADEMNKISAGDLGASIPNFGFASNYTAYRTGAIVGGAGVQPIHTFQPIPQPNGSESEGAAEIAFAPANFPAGLTNGFFVGFHGKFADAGLVNEENPLRFYDVATNTSFEFIPNSANVGHLNNIFATNDSLFISDFNTLGPVFSTAPSGAIYQITAFPGAPGDADLNGILDADDYFQIDVGYSRGLFGWGNGDFNMDGIINGDDYHIIDTAYPGAAPASAVPEPAGAFLLCVGVLLCRRRSPDHR
jgi:glucose/arabinose dehydrogenase